MEVGGEVWGFGWWRGATRAGPESSQSNQPFFLASYSNFTLANEIKIHNKRISVRKYFNFGPVKIFALGLKARKKLTKRCNMQRAFIGILHGLPASNFIPAIAVTLFRY